MGLRDRFPNYLFKKAEKRGYLDDVLGKSIRNGGVYVTDSNILQSSDVYELLQDISNQMVMADIVVEDEFGNEIKEDIEKAMMYIYNKAVRPIMKNFEDHLSLLFYGQNSGERIKFKINILDVVTYSNKTNIGYNLVRTAITSPDDVADMLGFPKQNTKESQSIYISNDLTEIGKKEANDGSLGGGEENEN
ncbi:hypothetical protein [Bacillus thuringiensis]